MSEPDQESDSERARARAALTSRELRQRRLRRIAAVGSLCIGLPTLVSTIYYSAVASPQYESEVVLAVEGEPGPKATRKTPQDLDLVRQHMLSRAALDDLAREQDLVAHYQDRSYDWLSRLSGDAGSEAIFDYYRHKVRVSHDQDAAAVTVGVRAFSGAKAQALAAGLVASTGRFLDELSQKASGDLVAPAELAVTEARARAAEARAAANGNGPSLEQELSREQLSAALRGLEDARIEAARRRRHLIVVAAPSLPDEASEPRRLWSIATVFVTATALTGVLWLLAAAVREHSRF